MDKNLESLLGKVQGVIIMDGEVLGSVTGGNISEVMSSLLAGRGNPQSTPKGQSGRPMVCPSEDCGETIQVTSPHHCGDCPYCGTHVKPFYQEHVGWHLVVIEH